MKRRMSFLILTIVILAFAQPLQSLPRPPMLRRVTPPTRARSARQSKPHPQQFPENIPARSAVAGRMRRMFQAGDQPRLMDG